MPIYEYSCQSCQNNFESFIRRPTDEQGLVCPKCQSPSIQRKFSVFGMKSGSSFSSSYGNNCGNCTTHNCGSCNCH